ncbi:helix-turn-helix domain-containing protein [Streptomyces acidiscabies]|uniref:helix-turn-helix domain-containing protein n=1 Tax=Streptomyces acidiscabies TaxID=42234 RepID=UPI0009A11A22|nr:helix-turn-helix transcriptional regulator [Streptomyces acidiscabies]
MRDLPDDEALTARLTARRRAIGDRVRAERTRQKRTQDAVWMAARISRGTYQRVEAGEEVTLGTLLRIAWVLDTPLAELVAELE